MSPQGTGARPQHQRLLGKWGKATAQPLTFWDLPGWGQCSCPPSPARPRLITLPLGTAARRGRQEAGDSTPPPLGQEAFPSPQHNPATSKKDLAQHRAPCRRACAGKVQAPGDTGTRTELGSTPVPVPRQREGTSHSEHSLCTNAQQADSRRGAGLRAKSALSLAGHHPHPPGRDPRGRGDPDTA